MPNILHASGSTAPVFVLIHQHEYGVTPYGFRSNEPLVKLRAQAEDIAKALGCDDFEPDKEEFLDLLQLDPEELSRVITL